MKFLNRGCAATSPSLLWGPRSSNGYEGAAHVVRVVRRTVLCQPVVHKSYGDTKCCSKVWYSHLVIPLSPPIVTLTWHSHFASPLGTPTLYTHVAPLQYSQWAFPLADPITSPTRYSHSVHPIHTPTRYSHPVLPLRSHTQYSHSVLPLGTMTPPRQETGAFFFWISRIPCVQVCAVTIRCECRRTASQ